ncbi:DUF971 domain-containing protein [Thalassoroseus pseudoceratinae]|uniref:DUF971 domain-containing protein n=1 Tax=Thalassoroseus pseudoceratinae TaxID=2713176 RepID=UPI001422CB80|nr:DUF971 domain-containing protein [Thalassoroseus pseudoceratinae]
MAADTPAPPKSLKNDGDTLVLTWADGATHRLRWETLRRACPCATCRAERVKPPPEKPVLTILKPEETQPIRPVAMQPSGNYAYHISFSDGHNTGIYTLDYLYALGEEATKRD